MNRKVNTHKPQFDLKTHVRDGKGNVARENHYRLTIVNGVKEFERPPGSGLIYDESGTLIKTIIREKPPVVAAAKTELEFENDSLKRQLAELKAQLTGESAPGDVAVVNTAEISAPPVAMVDNSEEIRLMEAAGVDASELKKNQQKFNQKR